MKMWQLRIELMMIQILLRRKENNRQEPQLTVRNTREESVNLECPGKQEELVQISTGNVAASIFPGVPNMRKVVRKLTASFFIQNSARNLLIWNVSISTARRNFTPGSVRETRSVQQRRNQLRQMFHLAGVLVCVKKNPPDEALLVEMEVMSGGEDLPTEEQIGRLFLSGGVSRSHRVFRA